MSNEDFIEIPKPTLGEDDEEKQMDISPPPAIDFTNVHRVEVPEPPKTWGYTLIGQENVAVAMEKLRQTNILLVDSVHFPWYPFYTRCPRYMEDTNWLVPSVRKWLPCAEVYANYKAIFMMYDHYVRTAIANVREVTEFSIETRDNLVAFAENWLQDITKALQVGTLLPVRKFKDVVAQNGERKRTSFEIDSIASVTFLDWIQAHELFLLRTNTMCDILECYRTTGNVGQNDVDHLKKCTLSLKLTDQEDLDRILKLQEVTTFTPMRPMEDFTGEELVERDGIVENFKKSIKQAKSLLAEHVDL